MAIDEHARHHLHELARRDWGDLAADTLMEMLPPVGWADVATKQDLDALRREVRGDLRELEASLFKWMLPTMLTGLGFAAALGRFT